MSSAVRVVALSSRPPFDRGPVDVARCWPAALPLVMLASARPHPRWSRWSILATPSAWFEVRDERHPDPLGALDAALARTRVEDARGAPIPFTGGWIGTLSYELGRAVEPRVARASPRLRPDGHAWPLAALARCDRALVHDARENRWWSVASEGGEPLETLLGRSDGPFAAPGRSCGWRLEAPSLLTPRESWLEAVARVIEYIRAGDVFQVNLTHLLRARLVAPGAGGHTVGSRESRAFALDALARGGAWHGALLELPDGSSIVSFSPELFLQGTLGDGRTIVTRPIKGTRPAGVSPDELLGSLKDEAELNMIVDLMRNDLGRIARSGSVTVEEARHVELHPTVLQAVATIAATLRDGIGAGDVLRATFPPGSVTGAPKIRAMQIIEELEPFARGPYCGAIGSFADAGGFALNVAIRTLSISPAQDGSASALYGVGCGIVADSDPSAEWQESLDKAAVLGAIAADAALS